MRANLIMFAVLSMFFGLLATIYAGWAYLTYQGSIEWVGTVGLSLVSVMALFIGFYLNRSFQAQGGALPEDRLEASIDDGDPELGHFSPWSWWPLVLSVSATLVFFGIAVSTWIAVVGAALFPIAIVGWVYEYYRGYFAR